MVLKSTSIHANFFPSGEAYSTSDAPAESSNPTGNESEPTTAAPTPRTSISRPGFLNRRSEKEKTKDTQIETPVGHEEGNLILVDWDSPDDPQNPMNWSPFKKWFTTSVLCAMCFFIGLATGAYPAGLSEMVKELGVSNEVGQLGLFLFNGAFSLVPLFLGPLSEFVGSTIVYQISLALFVIWFIPIALATNIQTVLIARFLLGASGAAGTTIIPGTLSGIWEAKERAIPVAMFSLVAVLGTVGAPLYSGFIVESLGWRWVEWIHMIMSGSCLVLILIFLRETRGSVVLTNRAKKLRASTGDNRYRSQAELEAPSLKALLAASTTRAGMLLVREPTVLFFSLWLAYAWSLVFALFSGIPIVFTEQRGWSTGISGLAYIGPVLACFFAFGFSFHGKYLYDRAQERNNGIAVPEARLYYAAVGALLAPAGMFIFAFTSYNHVHWIAPIIGLTVLVMGIYFIFDGVQAYLSDSYGEYASSAISAQGFVRNSMAASFPLFSTQMFHNLSVPYAGLLLALLLSIAIPLPFILIKYGERIRASSKYAATNTGLGSEQLEGPVIGSRRGSLKKQPKDDVEKHEVMEPWSPTPSGVNTRVPSMDHQVEKDEKKIEDAARFS